MHGYVPGEQPRGGQVHQAQHERESVSLRRRRCSGPSGVPSRRGCKNIPIRWPTAFRAGPAKLLGVEPNWILCGNGSDDILTIVTRAFVGQGDCLRLPYPSYILYKTLAQLQGAEAEEIHFQPDWSLGDDFAKPRRAIEAGVSAQSRTVRRAR